MSTLIIDVRLNDKTYNGQPNIHDEVVKGLSRAVNQKTLPTILPYDEEGLHIYEEFTTHAMTCTYFLPKNVFSRVTDMILPNSCTNDTEVAINDGSKVLYLSLVLGESWPPFHPLFSCYYVFLFAFFYCALSLGR